MIDIEVLNAEYSKYKNFKNSYEKYKKALDEFEKENQDKLNEFQKQFEEISKIKDYSMLQAILENNLVFKKWYELKNYVNFYKDELKDYFLQTKTFESNQRFIALKHLEDNDYDLIELYTQDKLNLSLFESEKQKYIIDVLKAKKSFICYATHDNLPLLMTILEDIDFKDIVRCPVITSEFDAAFEFDINGDDNLSSKLLNLRKLISSLIDKKGYVSDQEYFEIYYIMRILEEKNIEQLYLDAPLEKKEYIINAYIKLSSYNTKKEYKIPSIHIRTASSIINQEVLKRNMSKFS